MGGNAWDNPAEARHCTRGVLHDRRRTRARPPTPRSDRCLGGRPETRPGPLQPSTPLHKGKRRGRNLALALSRHRDARPRFPTDPAIPFSHNLAEQALHMMRLQIEDLRLFPDHGGNPQIRQSAQPERDGSQAGTRLLGRSADDRASAPIPCRHGYPCFLLHQYLNNSVQAEHERHKTPNFTSYISCPQGAGVSARRGAFPSGAPTGSS